MNSRMEMWNEMDAKKLAEEFELGERYVQGGREVELLIAKALRAFGKPPEARACKKCTAPHCFCEGSGTEATTLKNVAVALRSLVACVERDRTGSGILLPTEAALGSAKQVLSRIAE
jgi:hypothetical protein